MGRGRSLQRQGGEQGGVHTEEEKGRHLGRGRIGLESFKQGRGRGLGVVLLVVVDQLMGVGLGHSLSASGNI